MLKYKIKKMSKDFIQWDVRYAFKKNPIVNDYLIEIQENSRLQKDYRIVWIFANGYNIGYAKYSNGEGICYCNGNINVWGSQVIKCDLTANSAEYLYRIWIKDSQYTKKYEKVRPVVPSMLLKSH